MAKNQENSGEKRGPIEKTDKGWPINPIGVAALFVFGFIIIFLIARPLFEKKTTILQQDQQQNTAGGSITNPSAGEIVKGPNLKITLSVDKPEDVDKVQFWVKTYADNKWTMIGEMTSQPFTLNWQIPDQFQNKAVAITTHIYNKDGTIIKDPGGWREGIIILSN